MKLATMIRNMLKDLIQKAKDERKQFVDANTEELAENIKKCLVDAFEMGRINYSTKKITIKLVRAQVDEDWEKKKCLCITLYVEPDNLKEFPIYPRLYMQDEVFKFEFSPVKDPREVWGEVGRNAIWLPAHPEWGDFAFEDFCPKEILEIKLEDISEETNS